MDMAKVNGEYIWNRKKLSESIIEALSDKKEDEINKLIKERVELSEAQLEEELSEAQLEELSKKIDDRLSSSFEKLQKHTSNQCNIAKKNIKEKIEVLEHEECLSLKITHKLDLIINGLDPEDKEERNIVKLKKLTKEVNYELDVFLKDLQQTKLFKFQNRTKTIAIYREELASGIAHHKDLSEEDKDELNLILDKLRSILDTLIEKDKLKLIEDQLNLILDALLQNMETQFLNTKKEITQFIPEYVNSDLGDLSKIIKDKLAPMKAKLETLIADTSAKTTAAINNIIMVDYKALEASSKIKSALDQFSQSYESYIEYMYENLKKAIPQEVKNYRKSPALKLKIQSELELFREIMQGNIRSTGSENNKQPPIKYVPGNPNETLHTRINNFFFYLSHDNIHYMSENNAKEQSRYLYTHCLEQCIKYPNLDDSFIKYFLDLAFSSIIMGQLQQPCCNIDECFFLALFEILNKASHGDFDTIFIGDDKTNISIGFIATKIWDTNPKIDLKTLSDILIKIVSDNATYPNWKEAHTKKEEFNINDYYPLKEVAKINPTINNELENKVTVKAAIQPKLPTNGNAVNPIINLEKNKKQDDNKEKNGKDLWEAIKKNDTYLKTKDANSERLAKLCIDLVLADEKIWEPFPKNDYGAHLIVQVLTVLNTPTVNSEKLATEMERLMCKKLLESSFECGGESRILEEKYQEIKKEQETQKRQFSGQRYSGENKNAAIRPSIIVTPFHHQRNIHNNNERPLAKNQEPNLEYPNSILQQIRNKYPIHFVSHNPAYTDTITLLIALAFENKDIKKNCSNNIHIGPNIIGVVFDVIRQDIQEYKGKIRTTETTKDTYRKLLNLSFTCAGIKDILEAEYKKIKEGQVPPKPPINQNKLPIAPIGIPLKEKDLVEQEHSEKSAGFFATLTTFFSRIVETIKSGWEYIKSIFITPKKITPLAFIKNILSTIDDRVKKKVNNGSLQDANNSVHVFAIRMFWLCNIIHYKYIQKLLTQDSENKQLQQDLTSIQNNILTAIETIKKQECNDFFSSKTIPIHNSVYNNRRLEILEKSIDKICLPDNKANVKDFCNDFFKYFERNNPQPLHETKDIEDFLEKNLQYCSPIAENSTQEMNLTNEDVEQMVEISKLIAEDFKGMAAKVVKKDQRSYFDKKRGIHEEILNLEKKCEMEDEEIEESKSESIELGEKKKICK